MDAIAEYSGIVALLARRKGSNCRASVGGNNPPHPATNRAPCTAVWLIGRVDGFCSCRDPLTGRPSPSKKHAGAWMECRKVPMLINIM